MAKILSFYDSSDEMVYECECGSFDFFLIAGAKLDQFKGFCCQACDAMFLFPKPIDRKDIHVKKANG